MSGWRSRYLFFACLSLGGISHLCAQPALEIKKQVIVESGSGVIPTNVIATSDGGAIVVGNRAGKAETGQEIWVTKLDPGLNVIWRTTIQAGAPLPSAFFPKAVFQGPDESVYVLAHLSACAVDSSTGRCSYAVPRRFKPQVIKIENAGKLAWIRPLHCKDIECPADVLHRAISEPDGLILMRGIVMSPIAGTRHGRAAQLLQKITWDAMPVWQRIYSEGGRGVVSRIERSGARFVFAEIPSSGAVSIRSFDTSGKLDESHPIPVVCGDGSFFRNGAEFVLFCPTDQHVEKSAVLGGRLVRLGPKFEILADWPVRDISWVVLAASVRNSLVLIGGGRDEIGSRAYPAAAIVDGSSRSEGQLRFDQYRNAQPVRGAALIPGTEELVLVYGASEAWAKPGAGIAIVSLIGIRR